MLNIKTDTVIISKWQQWSFLILLPSQELTAIHVYHWEIIRAWEWGWCTFLHPETKTDCIRRVGERATHWPQCLSPSTAPHREVSPEPMIWSIHPVVRENPGVTFSPSVLWVILLEPLSWFFHSGSQGNLQHSFTVSLIEIQKRGGGLNNHYLGLGETGLHLQSPIGSPN